MTIGYLFLFAALLAFSALGIFHKVADHPDCRPRIITMLLLLGGAVMTAVYTALFNPHGLRMPANVILIGAAGGMLASLALFALQACLRYGKISTSWLVINLCIAVPVSLSIIVYREPVTAGKVVGMLLVLAAILLLWWDKKTDLERAAAAKAKAEREAQDVRKSTPMHRRLDEGDASADYSPGGGTAVATAPAAVAAAPQAVDHEPAAPPPQKSKWLPLIMTAFLANGLAASTQKVLVETGGGAYVWQFYIVLYAAGFALFAVVNLVNAGRPNRREILTASVMAVASIAGNISIVKALDLNVPGSVAYPVGNGGSLFLVVLGGVLLFKERINPVGIAGISVGLAAVLVLVMTS